MDRICLTLPTNRPCAATITALGAEAAHAAERFGVEVHLLVLDSAAPEAFAAHAAAAAACAGPGVVVHHLDEPAQRRFLEAVLDRAGLPDRDRLLDLLLPAALSYGACTDRAFLLAAALGCRSVHRRDSDSRYQEHAGATVFPIRWELAALGRTAGEAAGEVTRNALPAADLAKPVVLAGASFIGELSVDIAEIRRLDPAVYQEVVALWAPLDWSAEQKRALVEESFTGAGTEPFTADDALLAVVDPMRVDMCNVAFHRVHEEVPLPPATDTIGSDYFLLHLVQDAGLPGVQHNRHIVNYYTGERRTDAGFLAYQLRFAKFFLSMRYFNEIYRRMAAAGGALLDERHHVRTGALVDLVRASAGPDRTENLERLDTIDRCYRQLGGRYAEFAEQLAGRREELLDRAEADVEDFARLIEAWAPLVRASRETGLPVRTASAPDRMPAGRG
ncbi:DUF6271 family protein [Kitasatospora sp. LaBMicrA B282]|uniref:DUF6271 family protein n=1 Tax=Kitasatospora sp. LaBMicrA B282 TaxID=3420949 RepID=UPI003D14BC41